MTKNYTQDIIEQLKNPSLIFNTDSYKQSHYLQYPPKASYISSYIEARKDAYEDVCFFGLQGLLKAGVFRPITKDDIRLAAWFMPQHIPGLKFNQEGWEHIVRKHGGVPPLRIQAVKEGLITDPHNVLVQIVNTDPKLPWLTSFAETALIRGTWYGTTVASRSRKIKRIIRKALVDCGVDNVDAVLAYMLNDFGARGVSSYESATIGGAAHLVNFSGTDNIPGCLYAMGYYGSEVPGHSVPAAEHSTITSWGRKHEIDAYMNMITQFMKPGAIVAVVSDSYDIYNAVDKIWGQTLKGKVLKAGGKLVVRPDSGKPSEVVLRILESLGASYGIKLNRLGFKVIDAPVGVIQGDGVNEDSIQEIINVLMDNEWSIENVCFGMGGELLQTPNRDTMGFAQKGSAIMLDVKEWQGFSKDPVGDAVKKSKAGRLALVSSSGIGFSSAVTIAEEDLGATTNMLEEVWNKELLRDMNFADVRSLAA